MSEWVHKYKPAASTRAQLMAAACLWTLVGAGLLVGGLYWARAARWPGLILLVAAATTVGLIKAHFALTKTARRVIDRIHRRGDGRCLGGFFSWRMWLFVACMMVLGRVVRTSPLPALLVAFLYQAVGVALLIGAISLWQAYARVPTTS